MMTDRPSIRRYLTSPPTSTDALQADTSSSSAIVSTSTQLPTPRRKRVIESDSDVDSTPTANSTIALNNVTSSDAPTMVADDLLTEAHTSPIATTTATPSHAPEVFDVSSDGLQDDEIWVRPAKTPRQTATANATSGIGVPQGD